jgi:hypothetical protein
MNWIPGLPDIPKGSRRQFIVTIKSSEGKIKVIAAFYMNAHVMGLNQDSDPPPNAVPHNPDEDGWCEEYEWTGWSFGHCEYCECEWMESLNVIAHMPLPEPYNKEITEPEAKP